MIQFFLLYRMIYNIIQGYINLDKVFDKVTFIVNSLLNSSKRIPRQFE